MKYTVYKTTNLINGKIYIGKHQTNDPYDDYLGSGKLLSAAIEKYGQENFKKEILFVFDTEDEMNTKEAELVTEEFVKEDTNYNLCPGGQGGWGYVNSSGKSVFLNEQRKRNPRFDKLAAPVREAAKRKKALNDPKWKRHYSEKISLALRGHQGFLGKSHSEKTKEKIGAANSSAQSGKGNSQYGTMWITNGSKSKKIKKNDPIPEGWSKGRKLNMTK